MSIAEIGRRLKKARLDAGFTQKEVADRLGITYQAISNYERGTNRVDTDTLTQICAIYGIAITDLLTDLASGGIDLIHKSQQQNEHSDDVKNMNVLRIAGRDGSFEERVLTDEQLTALKAIISQLPDASEDL